MQGHVYRSRTGEFERWYNPEWLRLDYMPTQPASLDAIHDSLVASVVKRLMSDAPLGVLLSGGLDSSLVASIAVKCGTPPSQCDSVRPNQARDVREAAPSYASEETALCYLLLIWLCILEAQEDEQLTACCLCSALSVVLLSFPQGISDAFQSTCQLYI